MFCTKCGKQLHDGDKFCAYCGAKVREAVESSPQPAHTYEEVVFNPPFRQEAEKRTRQITEESPYSSEPKRERIHFDWNLDGFPSRDSRKEDDFELNWEEVIEKRREPGAVNVEKIVPAADNEKDMSQAVGENELQTQEGEKHPLIPL